MRRRIALATLLALAALGTTAAAARGPASLGVAEREFHITPYARSVKHGPVKFNINNLGQDTHNLVIRGPHHFRAQGPDVDAGGRASFTVNLRRKGTYTLLCTRANHYKLGMKARLVVR
jgi:plastocyanin